ncbi:hypothetical protein BKA67DRAFT_660971 [Truncatella angustata]|uniref:NAD(P)-binding protein n=1 Tax=Truncatella angustata TaxID=152316 RepID=A0A9P8UH19_9PEZI|nr:uncharacterized protein BKA67DRAFT_660971 [Truncatella angustata]KAH6652207.1 hypothetical protein BKA67DRAFT_660971 [Truncatella angustata]KAH8196687.1 hypothetical protein TruAng_009155 [Truncatella angustata]
MVSYKEVQASNALINDTTAPRVAVFVGGTSGIGKSTARALARTGASVRIYIVGRQGSEERASAFARELRADNPRAEVIWTAGEVSLLAEARRVCEVIRGRESRVDLLFLTAGYGPYGARTETAEGLEVSQSLSYYSRVLFVLRLLPLLREAEAPRVISVLAGGLERASIDLDDLQLQKPSNFGGVNGQMLYGVMNTATLEMLAGQNPGVTFIHSWPGIVNTGNVQRGLNPNSIWAWAVWLLVDPLIRRFGLSEESSGQRYLFQSTSAAFGGRGVPWKGQLGLNSLGKQADGLFLVNYKCDCTPNAKVMPQLREKAQGRIWEHTQEILRPWL